MLKVPQQVDIKSAYIQDAYRTLEQSIIEMVAKRISAKTAVELSSDTVFEWQLEKLRDLRMLNLDTVETLVNQTSNLTKKELENLVVKQGYDFNVEANRELANLTAKNYAEWTTLDQVLNQYFDSQWLDLDNHVNQTLISRNYNFNPVYRAYEQVLNDTVAKTLVGFQTPQQALKSSIYEMVAKGLKSNLTDKLGRPVSIESYVRTVIKSTTGTVYNDLRTERGINEYGIVTALMSTKQASREACSHIQGKFVLMVPTNEAPEEYQHLPSVYDYGWKTPGGCNGINCGHRWYSMLPSGSTGIPEPLPPQQAQENAKVVAKQRQTEVSIRKAKRQLKVAESLNDTQSIAHFKKLIRNRQGALRQLIDDNSALLNRDYSREQIHD